VILYERSQVLEHSVWFVLTGSVLAQQALWVLALHGAWERERETE